MKRERPGSRDAAKGASNGVQPPRKRAPAASSRSAKPQKPALPKAAPVKATPARKAAPVKAAPAKKAAPAAKKPAPARKAVPPARKPTPARKAAPAAKPAPAKKTAPARPPAVAKARALKASPSRPRTRARAPLAAAAEGLVVIAPELTEEERIGSSKFADTPARVFDDERFVFPETYGQNRVRLLVKDPQWLFAHWDVDPAVFASLRSELGERAAALSRLTLRVTDPDHGGGMVIHLPENARSWYLRADRVRRLYRAELGLTLPTGEYRPLALSNVASAPVAGGAAAQTARRRGLYAVPRRDAQGFVAIGGWVEGDQDGLEDLLAPAPGSGEVRVEASGPGPWKPAPGDARQPHLEPHRGGHDDGAPGGASDVHRR
jgi:hypothetical protein